MTVQLEPHADGVILPVRVAAGARQTKILGEQSGALKVAVTQVPEKGKANKAVVALLSKSLGLRKPQLKLMSGSTSRQKRFLVSDISSAELGQRVSELLS